jgi:hypothetical protein
MKRMMTRRINEQDEKRNEATVQSIVCMGVESFVARNTHQNLTNTVSPSRIEIIHFIKTYADINRELFY